MTYIEFVLILCLSLLAGLAAGLYVFGGFARLSRERIFRGIKHNWKYVALLVLILLAVYLENIINEFTTSIFTADYTYQIYRLEFNGGIVWGVQRAFRSEILDWLFIFVYLYSYIFILFFTPLMYMLRDDRKRMREYALAFAVNYAVLLPFYLAFAVRTPGYFELSPVQPILYSQPNLIKFISAFDPLDNCFPSGHVSGPVTVFLLLLPLKKNWHYRYFAIFMMLMSALIGMAVLYLGIHWFVDVVFGVALAVFAVWLVRNKKFMRFFNACSARAKNVFYSLWPGGDAR